MSQKDKLQALIQRAIDNGFSWDNYIKAMGYYLDTTPSSLFGQYLGFVVPKEIVYVLIFNHDLAKALFGNGPNCAYCSEPPHNVHPSSCPEGNNIWPYLWEYQLQQAVLANNPIDYMYEVIFHEVA
jgi:hypothetical protein